MDDADIFWSVSNSTASGTISNGEIGGSFYSNDQIYILGQANSDSDEYDEHVIIHEWGHYLEDNLARSDSVGGSHTLTSRLDFRVALSEGFANAFSGIVKSDPVYRDSFGLNQSFDFQINVETNTSTNIGWFNEGSVQTIVYDIHDSVSDSNDSVSLGFAPIYDAMTSSAYRGQSSLTSVYSLIDKIKTDNAGVAGSIDTLVNSQGIVTVADIYGTGETNNGGDAINLPVYKSLADDGIAVNVCSNKTNGEFNRLGNRQFIRLNVATSGSHNIVVSRTSGLTSSDPDIIVHLNGVRRASGTSLTNNSETITVTLSATEYILEVYEFSNVDNASGTGGDVCFDVTVS